MTVLTLIFFKSRCVDISDFILKHCKRYWDSTTIFWGLMPYSLTKLFAIRTYIVEKHGWKLINSYIAILRHTWVCQFLFGFVTFWKQNQYGHLWMEITVWCLVFTADWTINTLSTQQGGYVHAINLYYYY